MGQHFAAMGGKAHEALLTSTASTGETSCPRMHPRASLERSRESSIPMTRLNQARSCG